LEFWEILLYSLIISGLDEFDQTLFGWLGDASCFDYWIEWMHA